LTRRIGTVINPLDVIQPKTHREACLSISIPFAIISFCLLIANNRALADVTVLHVGDKLSRAYLLKSGVHRYTRYTITPDGHRNTIDVWSREISYETKEGRPVLHIHQQWDEVAPVATLIQDSWFEPETLRPLTHIKKVMRDGKTTIGGYRFMPDKIVGMDELADNSRKGFLQVSPEPTYNWETDMEFLQALPLGDGYAANINFYDPALDPPARYTYTVTGSDNIAAPDGSQIACWIVAIDFKADNASSRFWFAKKSQILMREEVKTADGKVLVKTLLNPESADSVTHSG
jgi:hypothetical protein